jgi:ABC-2 type transport system permease protein
MTTRNDVPSDFEQVMVITRFEVEKQVQSRGFLGIIALVLAVFALKTIVRPILDLAFPTDAGDFVANYLQLVDIIVLIAAVAFASGALSSEFEKRTGLLMFPQPVKRTAYLQGKFLSSVIMLAIAMGIFYVLTGIASLAIIGTVSGAILTSYGFVMLYGGAVCAVAFLFSGIMKTNTAAIVATVLTFLMVMPILSALLSMSGVDPIFLSSNASGVITYCLQSPYPVTHSSVIGDVTMTTYIPTELGATMVLSGYLVVSLVIAAIFFKRRQF